MAMRIPLKMARKLGVEAPKKKASKSAKKVHPDREQQFRLLWRTFRPHWPEPEAQHQFHATRKWRFDWAWPDLKVAVEIHGGIFQKGVTGHKSIDGLMRDMEKMNAAQVMGWIVIQLHSKDLDNRSTMAMQTVTEVLEIRTKDLGKPLPYPVLPE